MLPSEIPKLPTDPLVLYGNFSLFMTLSPGQVSVPESFVSLFIFYILSYLLSKRMGCLSRGLVSSTSIQKLFCGSCSAFKWSFDEFVGEKVVSPSCSSAILGLPPLKAFYGTSFSAHLLSGSLPQESNLNLIFDPLNTKYHIYAEDQQIYKQLRLVTWVPNKYNYVAALKASNFHMSKIISLPSSPANSSLPITIHHASKLEIWRCPL